MSDGIKNATLVAGTKFAVELLGGLSEPMTLQTDETVEILSMVSGDEGYNVYKNADGVLLYVRPADEKSNDAVAVEE